MAGSSPTTDAHDGGAARWIAFGACVLAGLSASAGQLAVALVTLVCAVLACFGICPGAVAANASGGTAAAGGARR